MTATASEIRGTANRGIGERNYTRVWRVVSDAVYQHPAQAISTAPVIEGDIFPYDAAAKCKTISADFETVEDSRKVVLVTANYSSGSGGSEDVEDENPLNDHPDIRWGSKTIRLPVDSTDEDKAIQNSAGQKFDPPADEDFHILVYQYSANASTFNENKASEYRGAINSDNFTLAGLPLAPYEARIASIEATNQERNGVRYWRETTTVEIGTDWRLTLVDEGTMKKKAGDAAGDVLLTPILDDHGVPIQEPVLLDGAGQPIENPDNANPVLLKFNTKAKPLKTFGTLGLPTTNTP
jgi:hypothetical protein